MTVLNRVFIASCARTPIGSFNGSLSKLTSVQLGVIASKAALERSKLNLNKIDECFFGNVLQANSGQAPATQVVIGSGLSNSVPATTVNKVCASGMKSVILGASTIQLNINNAVLCGGMESMSNAPYYVGRNMRLGHGSLTDSIIKDGLWDVYDQIHMGSCAEYTAKKYNITRQMQDEHCIESYNRATNAWQNGNFKEEIEAVKVKQKGKEILVEKDEEFTKFDSEKITKMKGAFEKDGTVTAGNSSKINDGASALVLVSEKLIDQLGLSPKAEILAYADAACEPKMFTVAPALAIKKALKAANMAIENVDLFELNEAFSVVARVNEKILELDPSKCNIWGGAVALGHPIGSSGSRIIVTLTSQLKSGQIGIASVCNGGGGASAIIIRKL